MGFLAKLFGKKDETNIKKVEKPIKETKVEQKFEETPVVKPRPTMTNSYSNSIDVPPLQGDYAKAVFLSAHDYACPVKKHDTYARYFLYECGIQNPSFYHKTLITKGYFEPAPVSACIERLKVAELKDILTKLEQPATGKKDDLVQRILETASEEVLKELCTEELYVLSELGRSFVEEHKNYVLVHTHKNRWNITWREFDANYRDGLSFYDVMWQIFNKRISNNIYGNNRSEYMYMYELLEEEGKRELALEKLLRVLYIDFGGNCDITTNRMFNKNSYSQKEMRENFDVVITVAPGLIKSLSKYADVYNDEMVSKLYKEQIPQRICDEALFKKLIKSTFKEEFEPENLEAQLKRAYNKVVKSLFTE